MVKPCPDNNVIIILTSDIDGTSIIGVFDDEEEYEKALQTPGVQSLMLRGKLLGTTCVINQLNLDEPEQPVASTEPPYNTEPFNNEES